MVAGDGAIDALLAVRLERVQGADLIGLHQAAVVRDISRHDGGQPPFDYWHGSALHHALGFPLPLYLIVVKGDGGSSAPRHCLDVPRLGALLVRR